MGVDIQTWRLRIGLNSQPNKHRNISVSNGVGRGLLTIIRIYVLFSVLVINLSGDMELNPGPPREARGTRQQTLSFSMPSDRRLSSGGNADPECLSRTPDMGRDRWLQSELFSYLAQMKTNLSTQMSTENQDIMKEVGTINRKIDSLTKQVNDLQTENDLLKSENAKMQKQLFSVASKLDYIEE